MISNAEMNRLFLLCLGMVISMGNYVISNYNFEDGEEEMSGLER